MMSSCTQSSHTKTQKKSLAASVVHDVATAQSLWTLGMLSNMGYVLLTRVKSLVSSFKGISEKVTVASGS